MGSQARLQTLLLFIYKQREVCIQTHNYAHIWTFLRIYEHVLCSYIHTLLFVYKRNTCSYMVCSARIQTLFLFIYKQCEVCIRTQHHVHIWVNEHIYEHLHRSYTNALTFVYKHAISLYTCNSVHIRDRTCLYMHCYKVHIWTRLHYYDDTYMSIMTLIRRI